MHRCLTIGDRMQLYVWVSESNAHLCLSDSISVSATKAQMHE